MARMDKSLVYEFTDLTEIPSTPVEFAQLIQSHPVFIALTIPDNDNHTIIYQFYQSYVLENYSTDNTYTFLAYTLPFNFSATEKEETPILAITYYYDNDAWQIDLSFDNQDKFGHSYRIDGSLSTSDNSVSITDNFQDILKAYTNHKYLYLCLNLGGGSLVSKYLNFIQPTASGGATRSFKFQCINEDGTIDIITITEDSTATYTTSSLPTSSSSGESGTDEVYIGSTQPTAGQEIWIDTSDDTGAEGEDETTYVTTDDLANYALKSELFSGSYNDLSDKPTLFSGSYNDLSDKPTTIAVSTSISAASTNSNAVTPKAVYDYVQTAITSLPTVYTGDTTPDSTLGNNGDLYLVIGG